MLFLLAKTLLLIAFWYGSILIHELGHLLAGLLVGFKPLFLSVGYSRRRTIFKTGDMEWQLGLNPCGGMVRAVALNPAYFRFRRFVYVSGGIVANACVLAALVLFGWGTVWFDTLSGWWQSAILGFMIMEFMLLVSCVVPHDVRMEGRSLPSDGKLLWNLIWMKKENARKRFADDAYLVGRMYLNTGRFPEAKKILFTDGKSIFGTAFWINCLIGAGKIKEAREEIDRVIAEAADTKLRVEILDEIACLPVYYDRQEMTGDAMCYIEEAIALEPGKITLKGTKGSLLIEQGQLDEGIRLLEEVWNNSTASHDKEVSEYFLALAFHRKNDPQQCHKYLNAGLARNPNSSVRWRVEREIKGEPKIRPWDVVAGISSVAPAAVD